MFPKPRLLAGSLGTALILFPATRAVAQTAATPPAYAYCSGRAGTGNVTATSKSTIYISDVFSFPAGSQGAMRSAFRQYLATQDTTATAASCIFKPSQQAAASDKQANLTALRALAQTAGVAGSVQVVETGWKYQASATPVGATPTATVQPSASARVPASAVTATQAPESTAAGTTSNSIAGSASSSLSATGASVKQSAQASAAQSMQSVQDSSAKTMADTVDSVTKSAQDSIQQGMKNLFNRKKAAPAASQNAAAPTAPTAGAVTTAASPVMSPGGASAVPMTLVSGAPAGATAVGAPTASKPTIQDEGDGKHWILMLPGDPDGHELTPAPGSKTVFTEDATGDKYILTPEGEVRHIPHKNTAKQ